MKVTTRKEARSAGAKRYFTGKPCKHGHVAERLVSNAGCVVCTHARVTAWAKANPDKVRARHRAWVRANPEQSRAHSRAWRKANPGKVRVAGRAWVDRNPEQCIAQAALRRARKLNATPSWARKDVISVIYALAQSRKMHVDHIVPLKGQNVCGLHVHNNMQLLTPSKNCSKGNYYG